GLRTGSLDEPLLHRLELKVPEKELPEGKIMDAVLVFTDDRTQDARYHTQKDGIAKAPKMDSPVMMVAAGDYHSVVKNRDGTVWTWGKNEHGQLGDGTTEDRNRPVQVKGPGGRAVLRDITLVSAGAGHSVAVGRGGTVWAWGRNAEGELGQGNTSERIETPVQVKNADGTGFFTGASQISAGAEHTLVRRDDDTLWGWGHNVNGRLGQGIGAPRILPLPRFVRTPDGAGMLREISAIAGGADHSLVLRTNGTLWTFGANSSGQLGDNRF